MYISFGFSTVQTSRGALKWPCTARGLAGDINLVHVTDVHSWISGHRHGDDTANGANVYNGGDVVPTAVQVRTALSDRNNEVP